METKILEPSKDKLVIVKIPRNSLQNAVVLQKLKTTIQSKLPEELKEQVLILPYDITIETVDIEEYLDSLIQKVKELKNKQS